jgi:lysophospholipase L1-like esterase
MHWPTWCLYAAITLATLVGAEFIARVYDWSPRSSDFAAGDHLGVSRYNFSAAGFGDLVPAQDGHWVTWFHRPYHVQTNSVGLRNVEEPSEQSFRILAVGDSQTFGLFLANEDTWPGWTESILRQRDSPAERIQIFNAGMMGYTIVDELSYLKDKGIAFKPRLVILAVFENDLRDLAKERKGARRRPESVAGSAVANFFKTVGRSLALVSLANQAKARAELAAANVDIRAALHGATGWSPPTPDDAVLAARYTTHFNAAAELLKSHAIEFAVVFIPAADSMDVAKPSIMEPVIRGVAAATNIPYLDMTTTFRARPDPVSRLYLLQHGPAGALTGDGHLSREGNAVIGRTLADWLVERRLVP